METNPDLGTQHRKSVETPTVRLTLNFGIDPQKAGQEMLLQAVPRSCGNPWESFPSCLAKDGSSSFRLTLESLFKAGISCGFLWERRGTPTGKVEKPKRGLCPRCRDSKAPPILGNSLFVLKYK